MSSRSLQSHSQLYSYPLSECAPRRGARITAARAQPTVASILSSNAKLRPQGGEDFAAPTHSRHMVPQAQPLARSGNREGATGATIRKRNVGPAFVSSQA